MLPLAGLLFNVVAGLVIDRAQDLAKDHVEKIKAADHARGDSDLVIIARTDSRGTHNLEEAEKLCDQITIINNGKILRSDFKDNLINIIGKKTVHFHLINNLKFIPNI